MSSPIKPKTIRRLTLLAKSLQPLLTHLPNPLPRPGTDSFHLGKAADTKTAQARQEAFVKADSKRLDKGVVRFFASTATFSEDRRS